MRKLFYFALILPAALCFYACGDSKSNPEADSLRSELNSRMMEMSEMDLFLDAVNASMDSVVKLDGSILRTDGESKLSRKDQILENIDAYKEVLQRQRDRIAELEAKLKNNSGANAKLLKTVEALKAQIEEKDKAIAELRGELEKRNFDINNLKSSVAKMSTQIADLEEDAKVKNEALQVQTNMLNEAYVFIGTKKELKGADLLKRGKLNMSEIDQSQFTKIDIRKTKQFTIPSKKPEILTQAPANSYTLEKIDKKTSVLTITDPAAFWSVSKYLVIRY
jgi:chromosome segregation ATPase